MLFREELLLTGITQPSEVSVKTFFYLCDCFFLYVSMQGIRLEPTYLLFKRPLLIALPKLKLGLFVFYSLVL